MPIEDAFDIPFLAGQSLREKQIQQNYRPVIAVHKWFARRPGSLFRGLLLAEFGGRPVRQTFFQANSFRGKVVADPFMGGGTPLLEANRVGCDVIGFDINPMAWWIVRQELAPLDPDAYRAGALSLVTKLRNDIGSLYQTTCVKCRGLADAKYWLWVKQAPCPACRQLVDLFPGFLVAEDVRHPKNVIVCHSCGDLCQVGDRKSPGMCPCGASLRVDGPAKRGSCSCGCGCVVKFPDGRQPLSHRMFAMEYHCHACRAEHTGRFFKRPDRDDIERYAEAERRIRKARARFVPDDSIPTGDETDRLHRWGYSRYREMFNARQLLGLELSARGIVATKDLLVREALATNLSDLLRYQNLLCRYDTMALKSLDIFSVHGFPVGLIACESNFLGIANGGGLSVGSGGWGNIVEKYTRAKAYCVRPFEIRHEGSKKITVPIAGESIGNEGRKVDLRCSSATLAKVKPGSLDAVFTDPPYFANVQYAELMDFCYVWLRKIVGEEYAAFRLGSTRNANELTGNQTLDRGIEHFTDGLSQVFTRMAEAMKPGAPFAFTYHHNRLDAYVPVAVAILDAGLTCSASIPCPAEMGASIHISGTGSSVVDSIFVCRVAGEVDPGDLLTSAEGVAAMVGRDLDQLVEGGVNPTVGDTRCLTYGHLVRLSIWGMRHEWDASVPVSQRIGRFREALAVLPGVEDVERSLKARGKRFTGPLFAEERKRSTNAVSL